MCLFARNELHILEFESLKRPTAKPGEEVRRAGSSGTRRAHAHKTHTLAGYLKVSGI